MDMQEYIDKYSRDMAENLLRRFQETCIPETLHGKIYGFLGLVEQEFLNSILVRDIEVYAGKSGWKTPRHECDQFPQMAYRPRIGYTLPGTQAKPEYFVGELKPLGLYSTPTAVDDWENETHDDILVSEYRDWAFLGFSFEDPNTTEDWNADFAHLTPFAKGDDDEVVMAPYAVWRKKGGA